MKTKQSSIKNVIALFCVLILTAFSLINSVTCYARAEEVEKPSEEMIPEYVFPGSEEEFLQLAIAKKQGNVWFIRVRNLNNFPVIVEYNTQMCWSFDAENWTNLNHVETRVLGANAETTDDYGYPHFAVQEYMLSTSVAFSFVYNGKRYVTMGRDLDDVTLRISTRNSLLDAETGKSI